MLLTQPTMAVTTTPIVTTTKFGLSSWSVYDKVALDYSLVASERGSTPCRWRTKKSRRRLSA